MSSDVLYEFTVALEGLLALRDCYAYDKECHDCPLDGDKECGEVDVETHARFALMVAKKALQVDSHITTSEGLKG